MKYSRIMAACIIPIGVAAAILASQTSVAEGAGTHVANGTVFQAHVPCCQTIPVGHWPASSAPVLTTQGIPQGTYQVTANVFLVMQPSDDENCWLTSSNPADVINGTGGSAGNGSSTSGTGPAGVYGNAILTYTVVTKSPGDTLTVNCDSKAAPPITSYAAEVSLLATKVPAVVGI